MYTNELNGAVPGHGRGARRGGLVHGGDVERAREGGVEVDDLPIPHVPVAEPAAVKVEVEVVRGTGLGLQ